MAVASNILDLFHLDDQVAVVTGASFGLGYAMAEGLAEAGADIVGISRKQKNLGQIEAAVTRLGRCFLAIACDMGKPQQIKAMIGTAYDWHRRLDILVNNAGIIRRAASADYPEEYWEEIIRVNLNGVWYACQEAGRIMLKQGHGKIINNASVLAFSAGIKVPGYSASKGAVVQLTKALANEWACQGINVNAIAPGYFKTRVTEPLQTDAHRSRAILSRIPAGRWGDPVELKGAVVYLASRASDYVHGSVLVVDGGWCAR